MSGSGVDGAHDLCGAHLLLVEDDFLLLAELEDILREAGATVVDGCRTVAEALAHVESKDIAAAVLDVRIGRETVAPIARRLSQKGIPFIFYTGQVGTERLLAEWPASRILSKPALPRAIIAAVAEMLSEKRVPTE